MAEPLSDLLTGSAAEAGLVTNKRQAAASTATKVANFFAGNEALFRCISMICSLFNCGSGIYTGVVSLSSSELLSFTKCHYLQRFRLNGLFADFSDKVTVGAGCFAA